MIFYAYPCPACGRYPDYWFNTKIRQCVLLICKDCLAVSGFCMLDALNKWNGQALAEWEKKGVSKEELEEAGKLKREVKA